MKETNVFEMKITLYLTSSKYTLQTVLLDNLTPENKFKYYN